MKYLYCVINTGFHINLLTSFIGNVKERGSHLACVLACLDLASSY